MRAKAANLNYCAVPSLSSAAENCAGGMVLYYVGRTKSSAH